MRHSPLFFWTLLWLAACEKPLPAIKVPVASHDDSLTRTREHDQDTTVILITSSHDSLTPLQQMEKQMTYLQAAAKQDLAVLNCIRLHLENHLKACKLSREGLRKSRQAYADMQKAEQNIQQWIARYQPLTGRQKTEQMRYLQAQKELISQKRVALQAALVLPKEFLAGKKEEVSKCEELSK